jgi:hypothetical protein
VEINDEIAWLEQWLKKERKRDWVPWLKPIIAANEKRLKELRLASRPSDQVRVLDSCTTGNRELTGGRNEGRKHRADCSLYSDDIYVDRVCDCGA